MTGHGTGSDVGQQKTYAGAARGALEVIFGKDVTLSVLYYTGEPDQSSFEGRLRDVFGSGADFIINEIRSRS